MCDTESVIVAIREVVPQNPVCGWSIAQWIKMHHCLIAVQWFVFISSVILRQLKFLAGGCISSRLIEKSHRFSSYLLVISFRACSCLLVIWRCSSEDGFHIIYCLDLNLQSCKVNIFKFSATIVVSPYSNPQPQEAGSYSHWFNLSTNICKSRCLDTRFILNNSDLVD